MTNFYEIVLRSIATFQFWTKAYVAAAVFADFAFTNAFYDTKEKGLSESMCWVHRNLQNRDKDGGHLQKTSVLPKCPSCYGSCYINSRSICMYIITPLFHIQSLPQSPAPTRYIKSTYHTGEQWRLMRACASAQSRQSLRCSYTHKMAFEEGSDREPHLWPLLSGCACAFEGSQTAQHYGPFSHETAHIY